MFQCQRRFFSECPPLPVDFDLSIREYPESNNHMCTPVRSIFLWQFRSLLYFLCKALSRRNTPARAYRFSVFGERDFQEIRSKRSYPPISEIFCKLAGHFREPLRAHRKTFAKAGVAQTD